MDDEIFFSNICSIYDFILNKKKDLINLEYIPGVDESGVKNFDHLLWLWINDVWTPCTKSLIHEDLKRRMVQDLMNTLLKREQGFDKINLMIALPVTIEQDWVPSYGDETLWEILSCASIAGMKFWDFKNWTLEKPIDFPIQEDSKYDCSECMRPLQIAASNGNPYAVHRLLNLGACVRDDDACHCPVSNDPHPILRLINIPGCCVKFIERSEIGAYDGAIACYNMILADTPYYSTAWKRIHGALQQYSNCAVEDNIPSLKYITRFNIRRILKENNNICDPYVWETLGLPNILISYMEIFGYVYDDDGIEVVDKNRPHVLV